MVVLASVVVVEVLALEVVAVSSQQLEEHQEWLMELSVLEVDVVPPCHTTCILLVSWCALEVLFLPLSAAASCLGLQSCNEGMPKTPQSCHPSQPSLASAHSLS